MRDPLVDPLLEALRLTPDNAPLRLSLVRLLLDRHRWAEAGLACREGL